MEERNVVCVAIRVGLSINEIKEEKARSGGKKENISSIRLVSS